MRKLAILLFIQLVSPLSKPVTRPQPRQVDCQLSLGETTSQLIAARQSYQDLWLYVDQLEKERDELKKQLTETKKP